MNKNTGLWLTTFVTGCLFGAGAMWLIRSGGSGPSAAAAREVSQSLSQQAQAHRELTAILKRITSLFDRVTECEPSADAREASMVSDLQTVRSQLELYRVEHGAYPNGVTSEAWRDQLWCKTDKDGSPGTDYGPYLCVFPANPFNESTRVLIDQTGTIRPGTQRTSGPDACGWHFDTTTGKFAANDSVEHGEL